MVATCKSSLNTKWETERKNRRKVTDAWWWRPHRLDPMWHIFFFCLMFSPKRVVKSNCHSCLKKPIVTALNGQHYNVKGNKQINISAREAEQSPLSCLWHKECHSKGYHIMARCQRRDKEKKKRVQAGLSPDALTNSHRIGRGFITLQRKQKQLLRCKYESSVICLWNVKSKETCHWDLAAVV